VTRPAWISWGSRDSSVSSPEDYACPLGCARGCRPFVLPTLVGACASSRGAQLSLGVSIPVAVAPYGFGAPSSSFASKTARRLPARDLEVFPFTGAAWMPGHHVAPPAELLLLQSMAERGGCAIVAWGMPAQRLS
jgi:hypothetical protein